MHTCVFLHMCVLQKVHEHLGRHVWAQMYVIAHMCGYEQVPGSWITLGLSDGVWGKVACEVDWWNNTCSLHIPVT